jgi:Asp-tRNA(Asn)/Glu-tRNA(Gln) amidotransferase C subunit
MAVEPERLAPVARFSAEAVGVLAEIAGLRLSPDRLPHVAEALREFYEMTAALDDLDLDGVEPELSFDARWMNDA